MERLQKVIASSGYTSRRKAEILILKGKVYVNGEQVTTLGTKVTAEDIIVVAGVTLTQENKEYYLLNKPRGYISLADEHQRNIVTELIPTNARIFPVGRLDYDTTGLLLLTNDGELANKLTHPKNNISKKYIAKIEGILDMPAFFKIKEGLVIEGTKCVPLRLKIKSKDQKTNTTLVEITIVEGRNHIVKKIFEQVNYSVIKLKREEFAFLSVKGLNSGDYRLLTKKEIKALYNM